MCAGQCWRANISSLNLGVGGQVHAAIAIELIASCPIVTWATDQKAYKFKPRSSA
jgi:hypothetical protein